MEKIYFNQETNHISILKEEYDEWTVSIYDIELKSVKEIQLDFRRDEDNFNFLRITYFKVLEKQQKIRIVCEANFKQVYNYEFDLEGNVTMHKILSDNLEDILLEINNQNNLEIIYKDEHHSYSGNCRIFKDYEEILKVNLLKAIKEDNQNNGKKYQHYEYSEYLVGTNKPFQIAFTAINAHVPIDELKIFQINNTNKLELIYEINDEDFDGGMFLTFNFSSDKFILLKLHPNKENMDEDNFSICEYSVNGTKKPTKIFRTNFGYWIYGISYTQYLTDSLICIVRKSDLILFDLSIGKTQGVLERDLDSGYYIDFNIIIYKLNGKVEVLQF